MPAGKPMRGRAGLPPAAPGRGTIGAFRELTAYAHAPPA